jgi:hypothetical protein
MIGILEIPFDFPELSELQIYSHTSICFQHDRGLLVADSIQL